MRKDLANLVGEISRMTDESDLKTLNKVLIGQFKYVQERKAKMAKMKLRVGHEVSFWSKISGATPHVGKIKKINRTKAIIAVAGSFDWSVPLANLTVEGVAA